MCTCGACEEQWDGRTLVEAVSGVGAMISDVAPRPAVSSIAPLNICGSAPPSVAAAPTPTPATEAPPAETIIPGQLVTSAKQLSPPGQYVLSPSGQGIEH